MKDEKENDRRRFLKVSGGALLAAGTAGVLAASGQHHGKSSNSVGRDPLGSATVGFGGWMAGFDPPLDRFVNPLGPPPSNHHELIPEMARIKAGGYVNFVISGLHVISVYDDGMTPADIDVGDTTPLGGPLPPVINSPAGRLYRGPNPVIAAGPPPIIDLDRVEVIHFDAPGTYLVICAVLPHFIEGMVGYVNVLPGGR
jgi:plastocyanin